MCGSPRVFSPTYLPPGLMTMALLLRVSSSTWAMLSLAFWYESSVAQTVILSWMPPKQSNWTLPSLAGCREGKAEWGTAQRQGETVSRLYGKNVARMATDKNTLKRQNVFLEIFLLGCVFSTAQAAATWLAILSQPRASLCGGTWQEIRQFWVQLEVGALSFGFAHWNWRLIRQQRCGWTPADPRVKNRAQSATTKHKVFGLYHCV